MSSESSAEARKEARRSELRRYIASSLRVQTWVIVALPLGLIGTLLVRLRWPSFSPLVMITAVAYFAVGRYITAAHIADFRAELRELDRGPARPIDGREHDGR